MPTLDFHRRRRAALLDATSNPTLLMAGGWLARNYPANPFAYRADSNFLYFFADPEPDSAALLDPASGEVTLFLPERSEDDALWHGPMPSFEEMKERQGVHAVRPIGSLAEEVAKLANGRSIGTIAVPDPKATAKAAAITGVDLRFEDAEKLGSPDLVMAIAALRTSKEPEEIEEMRRTAAVTDAAHRAAIAHTKPGVHEQFLLGQIDGTFVQHGCVSAYNTILSIRGEVLHNHAHDQTVQAGDIVLLDAGAEGASGYCSDVTRCWPVSGKFDGVQAEIYDIVLDAELKAIQKVKPGVRYRDLHLESARVIAEGLSDLGVMRGSPESLVETGAHALFFPHGVGHLIGLDVHDMEAFGDRVHYAEGRTRSDQFGMAFLRLDVDLEPGMTFTIEPGIYFVPGILRSDEFRSKFKDQVDFDRCEEFLTMNDGRGFGGVRIEDDVLTTRDGFEVLTDSVPKERAAVEALVGTAS